MRILKIFPVPPTLNKYEQKMGTTEKRDGNCHVLANSSWAILSCLLLADSGNFGISQRLSNTI